MWTNGYIKMSQPSLLLISLLFTFLLPQVKLFTFLITRAIIISSLLITFIFSSSPGTVNNIFNVKIIELPEGVRAFCEFLLKFEGAAQNCQIMYGEDQTHRVLPYEDSSNIKESSSNTISIDLSVSLNGNTTYYYNVSGSNGISQVNVIGSFKTG